MNQIVSLAMSVDTYGKVRKAAENYAKSDGGKTKALLDDAVRIVKDDVLPYRIFVLKWNRQSLAPDWNDGGGLAILGWLRYFASADGDGFAYAKIDLTDNTDIVEDSGGEWKGFFGVEKQIVSVADDD